jgi:hypothetical protein
LDNSGNPVSTCWNDANPFGARVFNSTGLVIRNNLFGAPAAGLANCPIDGNQWMGGSWTAASPVADHNFWWNGTKNVSSSGCPSIGSGADSTLNQSGTTVDPLVTGNTVDITFANLQSSAMANLKPQSSSPLIGRAVPNDPEAVCYDANNQDHPTSWAAGARDRGTTSMCSGG